MAINELDEDIRAKLKKAFCISNNELDEVLALFNKSLIPEVETHYLSHLISSVEKLMREKIKSELKEKIKASDTSFDSCRRLFIIELKPVNKTMNKRKAFVNIQSYGAIICYASYLTENEKRFAIAHEVGHIIDRCLFKNKTKENAENRASLFAYIALLERNDFYKQRVSSYVVSTDVELFNEYMNIIHKCK